MSDFLKALGGRLGDFLKALGSRLRDFLKGLRDRLSDLFFTLRMRRYSYSGSLGNKLLWQYFLSLLGTVAGVAVAALLAIVLLQNFSGWRNSWAISRFFRFCQEHFVMVFLACTLAGWIACTIALIRRPLKYLDQLVDAAADLAREPGRPILLPDVLREAQDHLNLAREKSLRDATAAKEAEQRKNDLIVYLAHDLKTPLTSVIGYLSLLRDEEEISPRLREKYTGIALNKALRLEDLINEFFDITRFNLTTLVLQPERTNLSRMLEQVVSEFSPILAEKGLVWEAEIAPGVELLCDRDKLQRVLDNLIRNAVSYSFPNTAIALTMGPAGEGQIRLQLQNHGRTIPPEKLCHIFEQFYRADSSRATDTGGAGLGLAIAREIVELHGGSIQAESADQTITFTVLLPVS